MNNFTQELPRVDADKINSLLELFDLSEGDQAALKQCGQFILPFVDVIIDEFYDQQLETPEIREIIGKEDVLGRLKIKMYKYVTDIFSGDYGITYVMERMRIGKVHDQMEIAPHLYISSTSKLLLVMIKYIREALALNDSARMLDAYTNAIIKLVYFDTQIVLWVYYDSIMQREHRAKKELKRYAILLEEKNQLLKDISRKDMLTGLYNKRAFTENLQREYSLARRNLTPLSILYIDLNDFKRVNDEEGHQVGDDVLRTTSKVILECTSDTDTACRIGGDEFCVICPDADSTQAKLIGDRIIRIYEGVPTNGVTLSIGIVQTGPRQYAEPQEIIKMADEKMYEAKKRAKNLQGSYIESASCR